MNHLLPFGFEFGPTMRAILHAVCNASSIISSSTFVWIKVGRTIFFPLLAKPTCIQSIEVCFVP
jgi:hypothetical protein